MGKTKTAFVGGVEEDSKKSSKQLYEEKKARQKAEKEKQEKVRVTGLKGGERVKVVTSEEPKVEASPTPEETAKTKKIEKTRGKKYLDAKKAIDNSKKYTLSDAISAIKKVKYGTFDETMEMHLTIKKHPFNVNIPLPHSFGKEKKVEVADQGTIDNLKKGKIVFDVLLATPDMMPKLVPFAKLLGPKGLMPNPKNQTIIKTKADAKNFGQDTKTVKTEKEAPLIHTSFGKVSMEDKKLIENAETIIKALGGSKQILKMHIKSTMSPSVKVKLN